MSPNASPAREFLARLRETSLSLDDVARFLDALGPGERVEAIRAAGREEQRKSA